MDCQQKQWCNMLEDIAKRVRMEWYKVCGEFPPSPGPCDPSGVDIKTMMGSRTLEDRDPGDLSGENSFVIGVGFNKSEDEDDASSGNKRKFSPSIRDLEQKKKNKILHHTKTRDVTRAQSPLPSPPVAGQQMEEEYGEVTGDSLSRLGDANNLVEDDEDAISTANCLTLSQVRSSDGGALFQGSSPRIMEAQPACESINMLQCCRSVDAFEKLNKIKEGSYGIVYRARDKKSGEIVALKKVKMGKEQEGFSLNFLREINILLSLHHPSISEVKEVVVGSDLDEIFIVMEYMEHDLKELMDRMNKPFHVSEIKCLMLQLLSGVKHLHDNWVLHRDLTPSNLLFNNRGELKICDFGLSRQYDSPLKPYTQLVVTLWYRAPELLFGAKEYSTSIDMWSLGCIMSELLTKEPLFSGKTDLDQLDKIYCVLGTPDDKIWPGFTRLSGAFLVKFSKQVYELHDKFPLKTFRSFLRRSLLSDTGFDLLSKLLTYDPEKRITAEEALNHPWFLESPLPTSKEFMPTFPVQHTQDRELC